MHVGLDGEFGEGEHHACKDVDNDLVLSLVFCSMTSFTFKQRSDGFIPAG